MENNIVLKSLIETLMKQNKLEMWNIKPGKRGKIYLNACFGSLLSDNEADLQVEHSLNSSIYFKRKSENQLIRDSDRVKNHRDISSNISRRGGSSHQRSRKFIERAEHSSGYIWAY